MKYKLDLGTMVNQRVGHRRPSSRTPGSPAVICACDPVMLALGLTPKSNEQGYEPEWITAGPGASSSRTWSAQLIDPRQWSQAFGLAFNAEPEPLGRSFPTPPTSRSGPNDEPVFGYEEIYYQMYLLAIGIQMAGPNLDAGDLRGRHVPAYPGGTGPRGSWSFGEGDYRPPTTSGRSGGTRTGSRSRTTSEGVGGAERRCPLPARPGAEGPAPYFEGAVEGRRLPVACLAGRPLPAGQRPLHRSPAAPVSMRPATGAPRSRWRAPGLRPSCR